MKNLSYWHLYIYTLAQVLIGRTCFFSSKFSELFTSYVFYFSSKIYIAKNTLNRHVLELFENLESIFENPIIITILTGSYYNHICLAIKNLKIKINPRLFLVSSKCQSVCACPN